MSRSVTKAAFTCLAGPVKSKRPSRPTLSPFRAASCQCFRRYASSAPTTYEPKPYSEPPIDRPRWSVSPPRYRAPYRSNAPVRDEENDDYPVNEDPEILDRAYDRFLGPDGRSLLSEEVKWLAVTHKSFDHGKRGYNERLGLLGKSIIDLQLSLALIHRPQRSQKKEEVDVFDREPFRHPALEGVNILMRDKKSTILNRINMCELAEYYELPKVVRWKPRYVCLERPRNLLLQGANFFKTGKLKESGMERVYAEVVYAIVGALTLEQGGIVANEIVRERVLRRLLPS